MMKNRLPGQDELTGFLLAMSNLAPCRVLTLGGGADFLLEQGYFAQELDLGAQPEEEFDATLLENGGDSALWQEALRVLKPGGHLLLADLCVTDVKTHVLALQEAGFEVLHVEDATALWEGPADAKTRYFLSVCRKP